MPFDVGWYTLLENLDDLPPDATFVTPLTENRFRVTDTQDQRVVIEFRDDGESRPLQREQFETLYRRVQDAHDGFELARLPPDAAPYAAVLTAHPRFEVDDREGVIRETDDPTTTQVLDEDIQAPASSDGEQRAEPDLDVYADAVLLIDALERHAVDQPQDLETPTLVDLYTLLSDVQRNANELRQDLADVLLDRLHHDRPVAGQYGSAQRTTRRRRELQDDEEVLATLEEAGIDRERVLGVDPDKVDDALEVTDLSETDVYDVEETEYVRKAEVDDEVKETRLQGLKDQLATTESEEAEQLRREIDELEARIEELTSFDRGGELRSTGGSSE